MPPTGKITFKTVVKIARKLPGVEEGTAFGMPAIRVKGKFLACLHTSNDNSIALRVGSFDDKEYLLKSNPKVFFTTPHYDGYPGLRVRLGAVSEKTLREVLTDAWRRAAPKKLVKEFDAAL